MAGGALKTVNTISLLLVPVSLAGLVGSALFANGLAPAQDEIDRKIIRTNKIRAMPAWVWLDGGDELMAAEPAADGGVYFAGFYPEKEITADRLKELRRYPLIPNWEMFVKRKIDAIRVVWYPVPGKPGLRCGGLVQIVHAKNPTPLVDAVEDIARRWETYLPERPLDENCRLGPPPTPPIEHATQEEIPGFGPIIRESARNCDEFSPESRGNFSLSPDTRIDFQRIIVDQPEKNKPNTKQFRYRYEYIKPLDAYFSKFIQSFKSVLMNYNIREPQILTFGNYDPRPQDLSLHVRIIEDPGADKFCYIATVKQGDSVRQIVQSESRHGRVLYWNRSPGHLESDDPDKWIGGTGARVAELLFEPQ